MLYRNNLYCTFFNKLKSPLPKDASCKFGWNWPCGSWQDFYISSMYFRYFVIIFPFKKGMALHLNKLESPPPKNALCQCWLKLAQWFWEEDFFFNFVNVFSLFRNYLPLDEGVALHMNKLESSSHKDALCQVWLKLAQLIWRRRWKCEKNDNDDDDNNATGNGQIVIRKAHLSLRLLLH